MKRFWKEVTVESGEGGWSIRLDGRPVRTPAKATLAVPTRNLAEAIAEEWREAGEDVDPRAMPLTGFANAAIDRVAPEQQAFAGGLVSEQADPDPQGARRGALDRAVTADPGHDQLVS